MHLSRLELTNFKRFSEVNIDLQKKITVLVGPNSSGKSSLIKAILALKQTASPTNENEVLATQGEYVDLGVYRDYVFAHKSTNKIEISPTISGNIAAFPFSSTDQQNIRLSLVLGRDATTEQARLLEIHAHDTQSNDAIFSAVKKKTRDSFLIKIPSESSSRYFSRFFNPNQQNTDKEKIYKIWEKGISARIDDRFVFTSEKEKSANGKYFGPNELPVLLAKTVIDTLLRGLDKDFFYLGPLRRSPSRSYARTGHLLSVGPAGEHTPSVLANLKARAAKERSAQPVHKARLAQFHEWMQLLFPERSVEAVSVDELVKLVINRANQEDAISDVGFGISQVLPILVQISVMPDNSTLLIEQPELHLHPSVQTKLAEVVSLASQSGRRFIIETHSEHFVRGLQLAVSNSQTRSRSKLKLHREDVNFLYIPSQPKPPIQLNLNEWGEFSDDWPKGFFDEAYRLALLLLENKIKAVAESDSSQSKKASE